MIRRTLALTLTALAGMSVPIQAHGQSRVTATGVVTDLNTGTPVNGALVEFPALRRQTLTDKQGRFVIPNVRSGRHNLAVSHLGFKMLVREVTVDGELMVVYLEPDPVTLKGISVQVDRLATRRQAVGVSVEAFQRSELLNNASTSASEFVRTRMMLRPCPNGRGACVDRRGQTVPPVVYIDERRAFGLEELEAYPTYDIYLVEAYEGGRMIRVYTTWFMQNLARNKVSLQSVIIW